MCIRDSDYAVNVMLAEKNPNGVESYLVADVTLLTILPGENITVNGSIKNKAVIKGSAYADEEKAYRMLTRELNEEIRQLDKERTEKINAGDVYKRQSLWNNKRGQVFTGSLRAYLFGAVSKASLQFMRDRERMYFVEIELHIDDFLEEMSRDVELEKMKEYLYAAIEDLPANPKKVLTAIVFNNTPYKAVSYTHLVYSAGAMLEQPIYMGGKIRSAYRMATIGKEMAELNKQYTRTYCQ